MNRIYSVVSLVFLCAAIFFGNGAWAQDAERDVNVAKREMESRESVSAIQEKARKKIVLEAGAITFEDILKSPDDVNLNFQFAKQQVAENNMLGAASTLERILIANPKLDSIRLFYLVVLFRLDNLTAAQQEIEILKARQLPGDLLSELKRYEKEIKKRQRSTHLAISESLGMGLNTNRNASSSSKKNYFANTLIDVAPTSRARRDTHFLNITSVDVAQDLPFQDGHQLLGSFTYFRQEQTSMNNLDLAALQYEFGGKFKSKWLNVKPMFEASHTLLSGESFLRSYGGSVLLDRDFLNGRLNVFHLERLANQNYLNITESNTAYQRRGNQYEFKQGATYALNSTMSVSAALGYLHKKAKEDFNAYDRIDFDLGHQWIWPQGQFLINALTAGFDQYDEPDLALASRERHDRNLRYRVTYGAPLGTLLFPLKKILPGEVKNITTTFSYEYYRAFSNYANYSYHSNQIQMLFTKRWEF